MFGFFLVAVGFFLVRFFAVRFFAAGRFFAVRFFALRFLRRVRGLTTVTVYFLRAIRRPSPDR